MKALIGLAAASLLGGGLYATDMFTPGTVYDKPFVQAYDDLSTMKMLPLLGETAAYGVKRPAIATITSTRTPDAIQWAIAVGPTKLGTFMARLSAIDGSRTRVLLSVRPAATESSAVKADEADAMIVELARVVMTEQVDARLEDRAPDSRAIAIAMARYITADEGNLRTFGGGVGDAMSAATLQLNEDKKPPEQWTPPPTRQDATRPSVTFPSR